MYQRLFGLLLTDRGPEFAKPQLFEVNAETGEIRSNIFYCDATNTKPEATCRK